MQSPSVHLQLLFILSLLSPFAGAEGFQKQLTRTAEAYLQQKAEQTANSMNADNFQIKIRPLAEHAKLPTCKTDIEMKDFNQTPYGEQILQAVCKDHWKLLLKARIRIYLPVIVSTQTIRSGKLITEQDIEWQSRDISQLSQGYFTKPQQVIGKLANATIKPDTPLNLPLFEE